MQLIVCIRHQVGKKAKLCSDFSKIVAEMLELADNTDLKSVGDKTPCGFESHSRHQGLGGWRSWLARLLDMQKVIGSTPIPPTTRKFGFAAKK